MKIKMMIFGNLQGASRGRHHYSIGKTLIFIHIGKTAGSTLAMIIRGQFPQAAIFAIDGSSPQNTQKSIDCLKRLPEKDRTRIRCLTGHMSFGLHEYLPQPSTYFTVLRDPVYRVISEYYHVLRTPAHFLHSEVTSKNISLEDYVRNGMVSAWNGQTAIIRGAPGDSLPAFGLLSSDDLEIAKNNLENHFTVVGLTERFDESLILLKRTFKWSGLRNILYLKQNVGRNRPPKDDIANGTLKLIKRYNELDIALYEFAKHRFEEQIHEQDSSFRRELQTFRLCNKVYSRIINSKLYGGVHLLRSWIDKVKTQE